MTLHGSGLQSIMVVREHALGVDIVREILAQVVRGSDTRTNASRLRRMVYRLCKQRAVHVTEGRDENLEPAKPKSPDC